MSSMVWLDWLLPDSTNPAYRIQGASVRAGNTCRIARRTYSATDMPAALASRFTTAYSCLSGLICVRIMLSANYSTISRRGSPDSQVVDPFEGRAADAADDRGAISADQEHTSEIQ